MKRITRDDTEHGVEYYRANEVDSLLTDQPAQQEPVGEITCWTVKGNLKNTDSDYYGNLPDGTHLLYTSPPAQRTWVGLTHEEHMEIMTGMMTTSSRMAAVEAKLKEKNT